MCRWWVLEEARLFLLRTTPNRFSPLLKFARTPLFGGWLRPSDPGSLLYPAKGCAPLRSPERAPRAVYGGAGSSLSLLMRALRPAPRPTFSRRGKQQHKCCERYARNLLVLDFEEVLTSGEGGLAPFDPLAFCPSGFGSAGKKARGILGGKESAAPRIENTECSLDETKARKNKTDLPTISKWQIGLLLCLKVARRDA